jgi:hypothetical protein
MRIRLSLLLVPLLLLGARDLRGQAGDPDSRSLVGRVIDATTGTPLVGAFVHRTGEDQGVLTDDEGRFRLPGIPAGIVSLSVEQLGYVTQIRTSLVSEDADPIVLALDPDPILLEGIQVVTDRFERRRRALAVSSQAFDREDLVTSPAFNVLDFVTSRTPLRPFRCGSVSLDGICAFVRGRIRPVTVYVDEAPFLGGLAFLEMMEPHELQRVEVYRGGAHIRVYTQAFMERAGRTRLTPLAVLW